MGPLIGLGISAGSQLLGGLLNRKSEKKAAASMNPWNVGGLFGGATFDPATQSAFWNPDQATKDIRGLLGSGAINMLGGGGINPFLQFAQGLGNNSLPGLFGEMQSAANVMPTDAYNQYVAQMGQAQQIAGQDVQGLMANRLQLLRDQAAPYENQAFNRFQDRLFGQGRMGSTGGALETQAFARGLGEADLQRQMNAQQLGLDTMASNMNQAGLFGGLAGSLFGAGLQMNDLTNIRAQQRMQNALSLFGFGQGLQGEQLNQGLVGLQGMMSIDQSGRDMLALGRNLSASPQQAQMQASNPLGGLLSGLGGSMMDGIDWTNLFKKGPSSVEEN